MRALVIVGMLIVSIIGRAEDTSVCNYYALTAIVEEIDYAADTVVCVDSTGNTWAFIGCEDWLKGDVCSVVMYDNNTENIEDDEIVSVRYSSYVLH